MGNKSHIFINLLVALLLGRCSNEIVISINEQTVYDPGGRLPVGKVADADLQGCVNLAIQQQNINTAAELLVLSCANSEFGSLENISELASLRFLDLGNNNISNITPLEDLTALSGINLVNNQISDIGPLFNIPNLSSVNLLGNNNIDCDEHQALQERLGDNLTAPQICNN